MYLCIVFAVMPAGLAGQNPIEVKVAPKVEVGATFTVTYTISSDIKTGKPSLGETVGFDVIFGPTISHATQSSASDGKVTTVNSTIYTYVLKALKPGKFTIPVLTLHVDNDTFVSDPGTIEISDAEGRADSENTSSKEGKNNDIFIRTIVSSREITTDETLRLTLKLFFKDNITNIKKFQLPDFDDFLIEEEDLPTNRTAGLETVNGRRYQSVVLMKYRLTPLYPGTLTIEEGTFDLEVSKRIEGVRDHLFNVAKYETEAVKVKSPSVQIKVNPGFVTNETRLSEADSSEIKQQVDTVETMLPNEIANDSKDLIVGKTAIYVLSALLTLLLFVYINKLLRSREEQERGGVAFNRSVIRQLPYIIGITLLIGIILCLSVLSRIDREKGESEPDVYVPVVEPIPVNLIYLIDVSSSMDAEDLKPTRLHAVTEEIRRLAKPDSLNRMGIVAFARDGKVLSPLENDSLGFFDALNKINRDSVGRDGTAVGTGLVISLNTLTEYPTSRNCIILFTDGTNNSGFISPRTAGKLAEALCIRLYIAGVSSRKEASVKIKTPTGTVTQKIPADIDDDLLTQIARSAGGAYYRVTNNEELTDACSAIETHITENISIPVSKQDSTSFDREEAFRILRMVMSKVVEK